MKNFAFFARLSAAYKNKTSPEELRVVAEGSWKALSILTVILLIGCAAFGFWKILDVSNTIAQQQNQTAQNASINVDQAALDEATQALQGRTNAFGTLAVNPGTTTIPDPSQ